MSTETGRKDGGETTGTPAASTAGFTACVRYGFPKEDGGTHQQGTLTSIYAPIPEGAITVSPIYLVPTSRYEHQFDLDDPWAIKGNESCIAQEVQNECEQSQRVWYPVYVESDSEVLLDEMARSLTEFVRDTLGMAPEACAFYYSGGRSIHVHVPQFIETENDLKILRKRAEKWNEQADVAVDVGIYSRKRQFRLPGVTHEKRGLQKVPIEPEWSHTRIFRTAVGGGSDGIPETYDDILETVFGGGFITLLGREAVSDDDEVILRLTRKKEDLKVPIEEWPTCPEYNSEVWRWYAYNAKEFSPYANAAIGDRSVCAVEVIGTPYQRAEFGKDKILVPVKFHGAVGCDGKFTKESDRHAPLQLSRRDYEKYEREGRKPGDSLVLIGGQSRSSKMLRVSQEVAETVGEHFTETEREASRRQSALEYLVENGYDVGAAGYKGRKPDTSGNHNPSNRRERAADRDHIYPATNPDTDAGRLQQRAEQEPGIITEFTHHERVSLACRLLRLGTWDAVWEWFSNQFGDDFKPDVTYIELTNIINRYPDDYTHIEVPPTP